jgi:hypothetical protein
LSFTASTAPVVATPSPVLSPPGILAGSTNVTDTSSCTGFGRQTVPQCVHVTVEALLRFVVSGSKKQHIGHDTLPSDHMLVHILENGSILSSDG